MRFRQIQLCCCECGGRVPTRIRRVGLTPQHQLLIQFRCAGCKRDIYVVKDLADCWRECPGPKDELEVAEMGTTRRREPDAQFLHSLGVKFPDGDES